MAGSRRRNRLTRLRPDSRVARMGVYDAADSRKRLGYNRRWVGVSDDGFYDQRLHRFPVLTTTISAAASLVPDAGRFNSPARRVPKDDKLNVTP